jgi:hypothetical protein
VKSPIKGRCSGLPQLFACASSWGPVEHVPRNGDNVPAQIGTLTHSMLATYLLTGVVPECSGYDSWREEYGVDPEEVADLVDVGVQVWGEFKEQFPKPQVEPTLAVADLSGHVDVLAEMTDRAMLGDWKSGWKDVDYEPQVKGYAYLAWRQVTSSDAWKAECYVWWLRLRQFDKYTYTADDMLNFQTDFLCKLDLIGKEYNPGEACCLCPRRYECEACQAALTATSRSLTLMRNTFVTPARVREVWPYLVQLDNAVGEAKQRVRTCVECGGPVDLGHGYELAITERTKEGIIADRAWPYLDEALSDAQLPEVVSIRKGKLEKIIKAGHKRGKKDAAWKGFLQALREAGAVSRSTEKAMKRRKIASE